MNGKTALQNIFQLQAIRGRITALATMIFRLGPPAGKSAVARRPEFGLCGYDAAPASLLARKRIGLNLRRLSIEHAIAALLREYDALMPQYGM